MPPINRSSDETSHQGLGDSPDATLPHKTLPLARSSNRLELNSQAELNLPGSSPAEQVINYSEAAPSEGCPWYAVVLNVEYVEELRSELHTEPFRDRDILHE
jgi:hypothetical protein